MTWALYTFISAWLVTSAVGGIISGVGNTIGNVLSSGGDQQQGSQQQMSKEQNQRLNISLQQAKEQFYGLLEDAEKEELDPQRIENQAEDVAQGVREEARQALKNPSQIDAEVEQIFNEARNEFKDTWEALDKEALVNVVTERTDMNESEARNAVDNYSEQYEDLRQESEQVLEQVKQQAQETTGNITDAMADAALYLFIALLLGAIVAAAGGAVGVKSLRSDYVDSYYIKREHSTYYEDDRDLRVGGADRDVDYNSDERRI